jgi:Transcriptional regulator
MPKIIEHLRETIILEGRKLLSNKGYKELNVREIAKNCNIALGTFYNYFSTKDGLVLEIVREDWRQISDLIEGLKLTDESCKEKIRKIYLSLEFFISSYISIFIEMAVPKNHSYDHMSHDKFHLLYGKLSELIDLERTKGHIHSPISSYKLAQLIMSNLIYLNTNKYISFDELYDSFKI